MRENMKYLTNRYQLRQGVLQRMMNICRLQKQSIPFGTVFYGDSITELCDIKQFYPELENAYNTGIAGITTEMLLHFVDEAVIRFQPQQVVIMIGTNDLGNTVMASPRDIALKIKELSEIIHYNLPETNIYLVSPLPCDEDIHGYKATQNGIRSNDVLQMVYQEMQQVIPYPYITFIPAYQSLCNEQGLIKEYLEDGLHLTKEGYEQYTKVIKSYLL